MAFEDALVLDAELAEAKDVETALQRFEERRRPRLAKVRSASRQRLQKPEELDDRQLMLRDRVLERVGAEQLERAWEALVTTGP